MKETNNANLIRNFVSETFRYFSNEIGKFGEVNFTEFTSRIYHLNPFTEPQYI